MKNIIEKCAMSISCWINKVKHWISMNQDNCVKLEINLNNLEESKE